MLNNDWIKITVGGILLILIQVFVLNQLDISSYLFPQLYILILLSLPVNLRHWVTMLVGFFLGFVIDWFSDTQGLHASVLTAIGYLRYLYLQNTIDRDIVNSPKRPVYGAFENGWYIIYMAVFIFIFHLFLFVLQDFSFAQFPATMLKTFISASVSFLLILLIQFVFNAKAENV